jgi:GNAT superfamily N-acetyltransferase
LAPVVAGWLWDAFWHHSGKPFAQLLDVVKNQPRHCRMPKTFILLADTEPLGTASLVAHDLDERPDLTPWLAGMLITPQARGRGYAACLINAVEQEARAALISTLWLYTNTAERVYARAGWQTCETIQHNGRISALMKRDLFPQP